MTDEQTTTQSTEQESRQIAGETSTSDLGQPQTAEQTTKGQQIKSEAEKTSAGTETTILTGEKPEEVVGQEKEENTEETKPGQRAPEEYADFTVPDVFKLEGQELADFKSFAKEQDLTQGQAQKVLDFAGPKIQEMIEQPYKAWNELQARWREEVKVDPEIGGTKFEQSVKEAGSVFVPGESNPFVKNEAEAKSLREALNATGAGNNPEVVRLFVKIGRLLAEPGHLTGRPVPQSRHEALLNSMYPMMGERE